MSSSNLTKKLLPLRKALKNIKNNHQLKLYSSKIVNIIKTTRKRCIAVYQSFSRLIYSKFHTLTNRPRLHSHHHHHLHQNFSVVYIDELFQGKTLSAEQIQTKESMAPSSSKSTIEKQSPQVIKTTHDGRNLQNYHVNVESCANSKKGLPVGKGKAKSDEILNNSAATDHKWKIPALPQFRGIDERAEEFIVKFRQDMKLQREQSILDFEEMLKRSV